MEDVEDVEEAEEVEEVEDLEEAEEAEEVEDLEEAEEAEEVEDVEEAEDVEDVEEAEEAEDVEDVEEAEDVEDLEEVEEAEEAEEAEEVEDLEEAESAEDVEEAEDVEDVEDVEEAEEVEDLEEAEEAEDLEEVEEAEAAEEVEDLEEAEEVEELEELSESDEEETAEEVTQMQTQDDEEELDELEDVEEFELNDELMDSVLPDMGEPAEVEELDEVEEVEGLGPQDGARDLEELDEAEEVEDLEGVEPLEEVEDLEEADGLVELEDIEELVEDVSSQENTKVDEAQEELEVLEEYQAPREVIKLQEIAREIQPEAEEVDELEEYAEDTSAELVAVNQYFTAYTPNYYVPREQFHLIKHEEEEAFAELLSVKEPEEEKLEKHVFDKSFKDQVDEGTIEVVDIQEIIDRAKEKAESIEFKEGVFQVKQETIEQEDDAKEDEFSNLVNAVTMKKDDKKGIEDFESMLNLQHVDLLDTIPEVKEEEADIPIRVKKEKFFYVNEKGIDYKRFLRGYKNDERGIVKSLMEVSQKCKALCGAILEEAKGEYRAAHTIGLDNRSKFGLFVNEDPLYQYMEEKQVILGNLPLELINSLRSKLSEIDRQYIKSFVFLPLDLKNGPAYLFLGFQTYEIDLDTTIQSLSFRIQ